MYSRIKSTKTTASDAGTLASLRLISQVECVCVDQCASAVRAVKVAVFSCLSDRCNHVTEAGKT